jgi:hypothetical protein
MFDYVIAVVAVVCGSTLLVGGAWNAAWLMELAKIKGLAAGVGDTAARLICMAVGAAIILLGILVASGWRPSWAQSGQLRGSGVFGVRRLSTGYSATAKDSRPLFLRSGSWRTNT